MDSQPAKKESWKKTFFMIWTGQAFSLLGSELVQFSLVWYLTRSTGSAAVLALASFTALTPRVLLYPFVGALVDRWNRQKVMIWADAGIALVTLMLALLFWSGRIAVWHIYAALLLRGLGSGFHWPAMLASTSLLVPHRHLTRISGLNQTVRGMLGIVAPVIAALLLDAIPMAGILSIDIATALIAILPLLVVVIPQPAGDRQSNEVTFEQIWQDVRSGMNYVFAWKGLMILGIAAAALNFLIHPGFTFIPLLVTDHFAGGALDLSVLESAFSAGIVLGGLALGVWGGFRKNIHTCLAGVIGLGIGMGLIASTRPQDFPFAIAGMALSGLMQPLANGPILAIIQSQVDADIQGRVLTLLESIVMAMMPLSMLLAAPLAGWIGVHGWLAFGAVGCLLMGIIGFFIPALIQIENPDYRRVQIEKRPTEESAAE